MFVLAYPLSFCLCLACCVDHTLFSYNDFPKRNCNFFGVTPSPRRHTTYYSLSIACLVVWLMLIGSDRLTTSNTLHTPTHQEETIFEQRCWIHSVGSVSEKAGDARDQDRPYVARRWSPKRDWLDKKQHPTQTLSYQRGRCNRTGGYEENPPVTAPSIQEVRL